MKNTETAVDPVRLERYAELSAAAGGRGADLHGLKGLLRMAIKVGGAGDETCDHEAALRFGFGLECRFSQLLSEADEALRREFPDAAERDALHMVLVKKAFTVPNL